jgi:Ricin-type beta-trefoil lectin domain
MIRKILAVAAAAALPILAMTPVASAATRYMVSSGIVGACLAAPVAGGYATSAPCPGGFLAPPVATELWVRVGRKIVSTPGLCLTAGFYGRRVWARPCRDTRRQQWSRFGDPALGEFELRNGDGKCLDLPVGTFGRLRLSQCDNGDGTQNWFFTPAT